MQNYWLYKMIGAGMVALSIILGAFGAHALKSVLLPDQLETWKTACHYLGYQGLGIVALSFFPLSSKITLSLKLITSGIVLFALSLIALTVYPVKAFGIVTPIGGVMMISGWLVCFWHCFKQYEFEQRIKK